MYSLQTSLNPFDWLSNPSTNEFYSNHPHPSVGLFPRIRDANTHLLAIAEILVSHSVVCSSFPWAVSDRGWGKFRGQPIYVQQYRKKKWQIPKYCVKNGRNTAFMMGQAYLMLHPSTMTSPISWTTSATATKCEKTSNDDQYKDRKAR